MGFFETALEHNNENKDGAEFILPCNRYMGYSDLYRNDYHKDPNTVRYVVAMTKIFDALGVRDDEKYMFLDHYNNVTNVTTKPLGSAPFDKDDIPDLLRKVQSENTIPFSGTCKDYYMEFDDTCACCPVCSFNRSGNVNIHSDEEEILIDFLTSSPDIFVQIKPAYQENLDHMFRTAFDLHQSYPCTQPLILPFYKAFCTVLLQYDEIQHLSENPEKSETEFLDALLDYYDTKFRIIKNTNNQEADRLLIGAYSKLFMRRFVFTYHDAKPAAIVNDAYKLILGFPIEMPLSRTHDESSDIKKEHIEENDIKDITAIEICEDVNRAWKVPVKKLGDDNYIIDNHFEMLDIYKIQSIDGHNSWSMQRFESSVLTNTFMVIEAIVDKDGTDYLLFYDRIHKSYYSMIMDPKSEAFNIVKPYLTRKMYIKITFQPYHLYGICRKYDIEIKNIFSIQSCYSYFIKNRPLKDYESTINFFVDKPLEETAPKDMPMLMAGMQLYPTICARCRKKLDNPKTLLEIDAMRYFDEALGRSYYVGNLYSITGDIPPFKLVGPNKYEFPSIDRGTALQKGQFFTCSFLSEYHMSEDDCWTMIRRSIEYLAYKGQFRKLRIYITQMTPNLLTLFVPQYDVAYMETALLSIFSEMSRRYLNNKKYKVIITQEVARVEEQRREG